MVNRYRVVTATTKDENQEIMKIVLRFSHIMTAVDVEHLVRMPVGHHYVPDGSAVVITRTS